MPARLQLRREGWKRHEQSGWAEETSQEAEKWLKAERQYQTAEQNGSQAAGSNARPHENETTTATQPETKNTYTNSNFVFRDEWAKTSKAWTWNPVHKLLSLDLTWGYSLCYWKNPFGSKANIGIYTTFTLEQMSRIWSVSVPDSIWAVYTQNMNLELKLQFRHESGNFWIRNLKWKHCIRIPRNPNSPVV